MYEEEELEPPPQEDREDALDNQGQLTADGHSVLQTNGIKVGDNKVIASGDVAAASDVSKAIPPEQRTTTPYMTKYEKARVLGTRALQIRWLRYVNLAKSSMNAPVLVDLEGETDPLQIANKELSQKKIPLIIRRYAFHVWWGVLTGRYLPDGSYEDWSVAELL